MAVYAQLGRGDPAPWFVQRSFANPEYGIDTAGGRYLVLCFFGSAADAHAQAAIAAAREHRGFFDDVRGCFFGISFDRGDETEGRVENQLPGYRFIWDFDGKVGRQYGVLPREVTPGEARPPVRRRWVVTDTALRVIEVIDFQRDGSDIARLRSYIERLPPPGRPAGLEIQAPVLVLPNVFEPEFCQELIGLYETHGGVESGFMREVGGKTVGIHDHKHKRRKDHIIEDQQVIRRTQAIFHRRVVPMIERAHQFTATRMERYIVSCYAAEDEAHFRAHRDNTTRGTAHRRFAVSVNLNDEFDGGEVSFPEFGPRSFKAPAGGAVVFSCSLLHAVSKVTRGRRYAFLPFLYDEASAEIRKANAGMVENYPVGRDRPPAASGAAPGPQPASH
jgi:peroxiredoxin